MARAKTTVELTDRDLDRHAAALYDVLSDLIRIYQFRDRDRICCHDVSVSQCYALESLARRGPLTLNELASDLLLDKSTTSRIVDTLERKRLLHRSRHTKDKRAVQLVLSADGRKRHRVIREEILDREKQLLADFDPDVREAMIDLIGRLAKAAAERVESTGGVCWCVE